MEATMLNRQTALVVALMAGIVITSGALAMFSDANGPSRSSSPPQINAFDLMSVAPVLPEQKIDSLF